MSNELTAFLNFTFEKKQTETKVVEDDAISSVLRWQLNWREYESYLRSLGIDASSDTRPSLLRYGNPQPDVRVLDDLIDFQKHLRGTIKEIIKDKRITPSNYSRFFSESNGVSTYLPLPENLSYDITPDNIESLNLRYGYDAATYRIFMSAVISGMIVDKSIFDLAIDSEGRFYMDEFGRGKTTIFDSTLSDPRRGQGGGVPHGEGWSRPANQYQTLRPLPGSSQPQTEGLGTGGYPAPGNGAYNGPAVGPAPENLGFSAGLIDMLAAAITERLSEAKKPAPANADSPVGTAHTIEPDEDIAQDISNVSLEEHEAYFSRSSKFVGADEDFDFICIPEVSGPATGAGQGQAGLAETPRADDFSREAQTTPQGSQGLSAQGESALGHGSIPDQGSAQNHETMVQDILSEMAMISSANVADFNTRLQEMINGPGMPPMGEGKKGPRYGTGPMADSTTGGAFASGLTGAQREDHEYSSPDAISFESDENFQNADFILEEVVQGSQMADFGDDEPLLLEEIVYDNKVIDDEDAYNPFIIEIPQNDHSLGLSDEPLIDNAPGPEKDPEERTFPPLTEPLIETFAAPIIESEPPEPFDTLAPALQNTEPPITDAPVSGLPVTDQAEPSPAALEGPATDSFDSQGTVADPPAVTSTDLGPEPSAFDPVGLSAVGGAPEGPSALPQDAALGAVVIRPAIPSTNLGPEPSAFDPVGLSAVGWAPDGPSALPQDADLGAVVIRLAIPSTNLGTEPSAFDPIGLSAVGGAQEGPWAMPQDADLGGVVTRPAIPFTYLTSEPSDFDPIGLLVGGGEPEGSWAMPQDADLGAVAVSPAIAPKKMGPGPSAFDAIGLSAVGGPQVGTSSLPQDAALEAVVIRPAIGSSSLGPDPSAFDAIGLTTAGGAQAVAYAMPQDADLEAVVALVASLPESVPEPASRRGEAQDDEPMDEILDLGVVAETLEVFGVPVAAGQGVAEEGPEGVTGDYRGGESPSASGPTDLGLSDPLGPDTGEPASAAGEGASRKESVLEKMARKYRNFDPAYFGVEVGGDGEPGETPATEAGGGEPAVRYVDDSLDQSLVSGLELPSAGELHLEEGANVSAVGPGVNGQGTLAGEALEGAPEAVAESDPAGEDYEEPVLLLDQVVEEGEAFTDYGAAGHDEAPYDETPYDEVAEAAGEAPVEEMIQYPLEPWPEGFKGSDDQPVEHLLATMEERLFRKRQSRTYLVPSGANEANWQAMRKIRLKGM
ncbi:MAG: hypothetical protein LBF58_00430 [Deltaproteobacteria bacterium]|jgi:hypothetical protein|nr:hypothetical protein [Deltaproteobacteria bacterium]